MLKIFKKVLIVSSFVFFIIACSGGGDDVVAVDNSNQTNNTTKVISYPKNYNLSNADTLVIISDSQISSPSRADLKKSYSNIGDITLILKKIKSTNTTTKDVEVEDVEVTFEDVTVSIDVVDVEYRPINSININDDYIFLESINNTYNIKTSLLRKVDGDVLDRDIGFILDNVYSANAQTDSFGNIYTILSNIYGDGELYKLSVVGDLVNKQKISQDNHSVHAFSADANGNVAYNASEDIWTSRDIYRTSSGEYYNFASGLSQLHIYKDLNQSIVFCGYDNSYNVFCNIIDSNDNTFTQYLNVNPPEMPDGNLYYVKSKGYAIATAGRGTNTANDRYGSLYQFVSPSNTFRDIDTGALDFYTLELVSSSDNYYYVFGEKISDHNLMLKRINPQDDSSTILIDNSDYNISKISVTNNDIVNFTAIRKIDAKEVIGQISASGIINIAQELNTEEIESLEAINN